MQALRSEAAEKYDQASTQLEDLKHKKGVTENVVEEAKIRNEEVKEQLKSNENYRQISHLEERLSDIIAETKSATALLDQLQKVKYFFIQNFICLEKDYESYDLIFYKGIYSFFIIFIHLIQEVNHGDISNDAKDKLLELLRLNAHATT